MVDELALPEPLMCDANIVKMLTLIFPCTTRRPLPNLTERVDRILFAQVFRENNNNVRTKFFSDPLIKHLWSKIFIATNPEISVSHLRRLRSQEKDGEAKYDRLMRDMMQMEVHLHYKILPDEAKNSKNVGVFTEEEKLADL